MSTKRRSVYVLLVILMTSAWILPVSAEQIVVSVYNATDVTGNIDPDFWPTHNQADFYAKAAVAGPPLLASPVVEGRDDALLNWLLAQTVLRTTRFFPVHIELWDEDDGGTGADNNIDINPAAGARNLDLVFDACTLRWNGSVTGGLSNGMAHGNGDGDRADLTFFITTGDGRPFSPEDVAIRRAAPVQVIWDPQFIVADKLTSFRLDLSSSYPGPRNGIVTVTLRDGFGNTRSETRSVVVPPTGTALYLFDNSAGVAPWGPPLNPNDPELCWDVTADFGVEGPAGGPPAGFENCYAANNMVTNACRRMIRTHNPRAEYRMWDWITGGGLMYPGFALLASTLEASEPFRKAIYPIPDTIGSASPWPLATPYVPGVSYLADPGLTLVLLTPGALLSGIDRLVLTPRAGWFADNASLSAWIDPNAIGISIGEYAPHVVIAEANRSEVVAHEIGHTYTLSRRPCTTASFLERLLGIDCRDEYLHFPGIPAPYAANGFDVEGRVYPAGASPSVPGTHEVNSFNFMGATGAGPGTPYTRWIDDLSYNFLLRRTDATGGTLTPLSLDPDAKKDGGDSPGTQATSLVTVSGFVNAKNGILIEPPNFEGQLFSSYQFVPTSSLATSFAEAPLNGISGAGAFIIRLVTPAGTRSYLFTPAFAPPEVDHLQDMAWFAFAVPWDNATTRIELVGPSSLLNPGQAQEQILYAINRSKAEPTVTKLRAGLDNPPNLAGPQPEPPTIPAGHTVAFAWDPADQDSQGLKSMLLLSFNDGTTQELDPLAVDLNQGSYILPLEVAAELPPGTYGARVVVSDGINTSFFDQASLFTVCRVTNGGSEMCDGLDNDCNGVIDDATIPGLVGSLALDASSLSWDSPASPLDSFDVLRGDLGPLVSSGGGLTQAVASCLAPNIAAKTLAYAGVPQPGQGYWFLVRADNCGARGSWDSGSPSQPGSRDAALALNAVTCPACGHNRCDAGFALNAACDECVAATCSVDPFCCASAWDSVCVEEIRSVCGSVTCAESQGQCGHTLCSEGGALAAGCDSPPLAASCVTKVCQLDPACCQDSWDADCIAEVTAACQLTCN